MYVDITKELKAVAGLDSNKWRVVNRQEPTAANEIDVSTLRDFVKWLVGARRVARVRGQTGFTAECTSLAVG